MSTWSIRHQGSPRSVPGLSLAQIIVGLRDGLWETTDEVMGPSDRAWVAIEAHPQLETIAAEIEPPPPYEHPDETKLDMNPLIDVCLVLLIFFILTATYATVQKVVPVALTTTSQEGKIRVVKSGTVSTYMIKVKATGGDTPGQVSIQVEDEAPVDLKELPKVLGKWIEKTRKREMLLDVQGITWGTTIKIQDVAKSSGINKINYLMKKK